MRPASVASLNCFLDHARTIAISGRSYRIKDHAAIAEKEDKTKRRNLSPTNLRLQNRRAEWLAFNSSGSARFHLTAYTLWTSMNSRAKDDWPFDHPRNCGSLTTRQILDGSEPILVVSHDADDHAWQFIGVSDASIADGRIVCLEEIVRLDPTILEVANLPPGWQAVRDEACGQWSRRLRPPDIE
jgi:hypothetical protein